VLARGNLPAFQFSEKPRSESWYLVLGCLEGAGPQVGLLHRVSSPPPTPAELLGSTKKINVNFQDPDG
ncbi:hypothetical protein Celaphus_00006794, partial [Cervus elaphus hippelaphus]